MKVLIDGKEVPVQNDVKVIWENETLPIEGVFFEGLDMTLTATVEGIVVDVNDKESRHPEYSSWHTLPEIADGLR